jgi:hypothetical protein
MGNNPAQFPALYYDMARRHARRKYLYRILPLDGSENL